MKNQPATDQAKPPTCFRCGSSELRGSYPSRCLTCGFVQSVLTFGNGGVSAEAASGKGEITAKRVETPVLGLVCAKCGEKGFLMLYMLPAPPAPIPPPSGPTEA